MARARRRGIAFRELDAEQGRTRKSGASGLQERPFARSLEKTKFVLNHDKLRILVLVQQVGKIKKTTGRIGVKDVFYLLRVIQMGISRFQGAYFERKRVGKLIVQGFDQIL